MPKPLQRGAEWIWRERAAAPLRGNGPWGRPDFDQDRNLYVYFRRTFDLPAIPRQALAHVSADGRYRLFVNGTYVGRGPARCDPLWQYYDSYDIAPHLRVGRNVVAALVHSYGQDTSWYQLPRAEWSRVFGCGGFFFQCEVALPAAAGRRKGSRLALHSDESWRHALADAWERDLPGGGPGFPEAFDARREPIGWREPSFDDTGWRPAVVLRRPGLNRGPDIRPFPRLVPRDIPFLLEEERFPEAVITVGETPEAPPSANPAEQLSAEGLEPLAACRVAHAEALLSAGPEAATVQTAPGRPAVLVIDFGRVVSGYPRLRVEGPEGAVIDLAYSERLVEGRVPVQPAGPVGTQNADRYVLREGPQEWERFEWAGFRYLQLTIRNASEAGHPLRIRTASVNFTSYPVQRRLPTGFRCSDDLLNRLWEAGTYTLQLCMHDGYEDCPSREQRQWVGDAYVEMLVDFAAFGDPRLAAKLLRQVAQSQRADGMTQMATPGDAAARWGVFITDYCLSWIMALGEYVRYSGDTSLAEELFPAVARALAWFEPYLDQHGLLNNVPGWIFIDWADVDRRGQCTALNALYHAALQHAAGLARLAGAASLGRRYRRLARAVREALNARLWDQERGVYIDACVEGVQSRRVSQQANAACIALGVAPRARWPRMLAYVLDESRLRATSTELGEIGPADFNEEHDVVLAQPFFMHVVHRALAAAGRHVDLLDSIRRRWGAMLEAGSSTFWEHWHGQESQCHAWSATPTFDLSTEVLGVRPLTPGFARFAVEPHPAGLDWARGAFPSPAGDITVAWKHGEGSFRLEVEVPSGQRARVSIPPPVRGGWASVEANGTPVWADGAPRPNRLGIAAAGAGRSVRLEAPARPAGGPAGRYVLEARQQTAIRRKP
jgi:alpha-L-rhamnosidase